MRWPRSVPERWCDSTGRGGTHEPGALVRSGGDSAAVHRPPVAGVERLSSFSAAAGVCQGSDRRCLLDTGATGARQPSASGDESVGRLHPSAQTGAGPSTGRQPAGDGVVEPVVGPDRDPGVGALAPTSPTTGFTEVETLVGQRLADRAAPTCARATGTRGRAYRSDTLRFKRRGATRRGWRDLASGSSWAVATVPH
jgi:hypothetical protein